ncbi:MAG: hypothetical protein ACTSPY_17040 [Candidatus Helarchaeota archaeon]
MSDENISSKIIKLKSRVSEIVQEVNDLKGQLERATISLPEFRSKKENLQNELREILGKIAEYKEIAGVTPSEKKESRTAEQASQLMYYFQTDFVDSPYKAKVYLSITLDTHFVFIIDYSNYPERPILQLPNSITEKFQTLDNFYNQLTIYKNWDSNNPSNIYDLVAEIETILINAYSADLQSIEEASLQYIEETQALIKGLVRKASTELEVKNIDNVIEIYKSIIDLAFEIKDFKIVSDYTFKLDQLLKIIKKKK